MSAQKSFDPVVFKQLESKLDVALEILREAESIIGSEMTEMMFDDVNPQYRLDWLRKTRKFMNGNRVKPENLEGRWHT